MKETIKKVLYGAGIIGALVTGIALGEYRAKRDYVPEIMVQADLSEDGFDDLLGLSSSGKSKIYLGTIAEKRPVFMDLDTVIESIPKDAPQKVLEERLKTINKNAEMLKKELYGKKE